MTEPGGPICSARERGRRAADQPAAAHLVDEERTVGFHMTKSVITIGRAEPIVNAYRKMAKKGIGSLLVPDGARTAGIVTERRLIQCAAQGIDLHAEVGTIATRGLTSTPDELIPRAIAKLRQHHARYLLVLDADGGLAGLISQTDLLEASRRFLVQAKESLAEAEKLASRDGLTRLFTRRVFDVRFLGEFRRARRYGGLVALLLLDVDGFKKVNDEFGHTAGDAVLRRIGKMIRTRVRRVDIPARYGGDEFAILMPGSGTRAAAILGDCIRKDIEREGFAVAGRTLSVTVSGGVCKWSRAFRNAAEMFEEADRYLYKAKRAGRNRIEVSV